MFLNLIIIIIIIFHSIVWCNGEIIELQTLEQVGPTIKSWSNFSMSLNNSDLSNEVNDYLNDENNYSLPIKIILSTLATTASLITVSGNLLVMCSFFLDRQIRNPTNYFLISLSVSDFLIGLFSMPLYTLYLMLGEWPFGEIVCNLWLSLDYTVCLTSIYTVFFITIDRFCSVKIPAQYRKWRSPNKIIMMVAFTWLVPSSLFFTSIFSWSFNTRFDPKSCEVGWTQNVAFNLGLQIGYFWSTLTVIIILYIFIYQVARDLEKKHRDKQTKVNALIGSIPNYRNTNTNTNNNNNKTTVIANNTNHVINTNNIIRIPSTIHEKSIEKCENLKLIKNNEIKALNSPVNNSSCSGASKDEIETSESDQYLKNKLQKQQNSIVKQTSELDTSKLSQTSSNSNNDCHKVVTLPVIEDEFEELNYILHRRQFGQENTTKPIKEETILIKSPLKNGFFERISVSIKNYSRRSSQKSLVDQNNDLGVKATKNTTEKTKLEILNCRNAENNKQTLLTEETTKLLNNKDVTAINDKQLKKPLVTIKDELKKNEKKEEENQFKNETVCKSTESNNNNNNKVKSSLFKKLSKSSKKDTPNNINTKKVTKYENRARKALRTITFILGAFVFCFAPFHIVSIFDMFCTWCSKSNVYYYFYASSYFLCYLNSPINPFMYALANQQFKKTFLRILKGDLRRS